MLCLILLGRYNRCGLHHQQQQHLILLWGGAGAVLGYLIFHLLLLDWTWAGPRLMLQRGHSAAAWVVVVMEVVVIVIAVVTATVIITVVIVEVSTT